MDPFEEKNMITKTTLQPVRVGGVWYVGDLQGLLLCGGNWQSGSFRRDANVATEPLRELVLHIELLDRGFLLTTSIELINQPWVIEQLRSGWSLILVFEQTVRKWRMSPFKKNSKQNLFFSKSTVPLIDEIAESGAEFAWREHV